MRVVGGTVGGRRLKAPSGRSTRPTADRVREAVFNVLASSVSAGSVSASSVSASSERVEGHDGLIGLEVLDLFAGSGALGIEALSRGAASATFVESDANAVEVIETNLAQTGLEERAKVVRADVLAWLRSGGGVNANVAFCDPPYAFSDWPLLLSELSVGIVVAESRSPLTKFAGWRAVKSKAYGGTVVTLMKSLPPGSPVGPE
ncbi:MAG: RsmD family RNA methyltransferase [Acidimicrobiales bacterium]